MLNEFFSAAKSALTSGWNFTKEALVSKISNHKSEPDTPKSPEKKLKKKLKKSNRSNFDLKSVQILQEWYEQNKEKPYASKRTKIELAQKTNLSVKSVSNWLLNKRKSKRKNAENNQARITIEARILLHEYFEKNNQKPSKEELALLSESTGLSQLKVRAWFAKERFKKKLES